MATCCSWCERRDERRGLETRAVYVHDVIRTEFYPVLAKPARRLRIYAVLRTQHPCRQFPFRIGRQDRHGRLYHDWSAVERRRNEMNRAPVYAHAGSERPAVRIKSRKSGQE